MTLWVWELKELNWRRRVKREIVELNRADTGGLQPMEGGLKGVKTGLEMGLGVAGR